MVPHYIHSQMMNHLWAI